MNTKLIAGLLIGATALAAALSAPAEARRHNNNWNQFYGQNPYYGNAYYGGYRFYQPGAYGLNQNDPNYFRQAQQAQWQESQGGRANYGYGQGYGHGRY